MTSGVRSTAATAADTSESVASVVAVEPRLARSRALVISYPYLVSAAISSADKPSSANFASADALASAFAASAARRVASDAANAAASTSRCAISSAVSGRSVTSPVSQLLLLLLVLLSFYSPYDFLMP